MDDVDIVDDVGRGIASGSEAAGTPLPRIARFLGRPILTNWRRKGNCGADADIMKPPHVACRRMGRSAFWDDSIMMPSKTGVNVF